MEIIVRHSGTGKFIIPIVTPRSYAHVCRNLNSEVVSREIIVLLKRLLYDPTGTLLFSVHRSIGSVITLTHALVSPDHLPEASVVVKCYQLT